MSTPFSPLGVLEERGVEVLREPLADVDVLVAAVRLRVFGRVEIEDVHASTFPSIGMATRVAFTGSATW